MNELFCWLLLFFIYILYCLIESFELISCFLQFYNSVIELWIYSLQSVLRSLLDLWWWVVSLQRPKMRRSKYLLSTSIETSLSQNWLALTLCQFVFRRLKTYSTRAFHSQLVASQCKFVQCMRLFSLQKYECPSSTLELI